MLSLVLALLFLFIFSSHAYIQIKGGCYVRGLLGFICVSFGSYCVARLNGRYAIRRVYELTKTLGAYITRDYELPGDHPHQVEFIETKIKVENPPFRPRSLPYPEPNPRQPSWMENLENGFSQLKILYLMRTMEQERSRPAALSTSPPKVESIPAYAFSGTSTFGSGTTSSYSQLADPSSHTISSDRQPVAYPLVPTTPVSGVFGVNAPKSHAKNSVNTPPLSRISSTTSSVSRRSTLTEHRNGVVKRAPVKFHPMSIRGKHHKKVKSTSGPPMDISPPTPATSSCPTMDISPPGTPISDATMSTPPSTPDISDGGSSPSLLTPPLSNLSISGHSAIASPITSAMSGSIIAGGQETVLDADPTPGATVSSPFMSVYSMGTQENCVPTAINGPPRANSTALGAPALAPTPRGSSMVISAPQGPPVVHLTPYGSSNTTSTPHGTCTGSSFTPLPTDQGASPTLASHIYTSQESVTVPPQSPIVDTHSGQPDVATPGSLGLSGLQGPSVTPTSSPIQGYDSTDVYPSEDDQEEDEEEDEEDEADKSSEGSADQGHHFLETDGLIYGLTEEERQQMIRLLKTYLRQTTRSANLRTSTRLERQVKLLERRLVAHWSEPVCEVDTPRRGAERVWTTRAQGRLEQRAIRGL